jgi:hypothetical protein
MDIVNATLLGEEADSAEPVQTSLDCVATGLSCASIWMENISATLLDPDPEDQSAATPDCGDAGVPCN